MRKHVLIGLAGLGFCSSLFAQGTVNFVNIAPLYVNAPFFLSDGVTKLSGPQYVAELWGGPDSTSLTAIATTPFLTGGGAGYFNGGVQVIPGVPGGGTAFVQVGAWDTSVAATFQEAQASGLPVWVLSSVFSVVTGDNNASPPTTPAFLTGLGGGGVFVPEPSVLALTGAGLLSLISCWRRKSTRRMN